MSQLLTRVDNAMIGLGFIKKEDRADIYTHVLRHIEEVASLCHCASLVPQFKLLQPGPFRAEYFGLT